MAPDPTIAALPKSSRHPPVQPEAVPRLACRVVTKLEEWEMLQPWWDGLLAESPESTPWQGYAYLTHWWRHLSNGIPLRIYVVERNGIPCLILPLQISKWAWMPGLPIRMLEPIAMLMDVNRPRLALGQFSPDAYACAFAELCNRRNDWDLIRIDEKPWADAEVALLRDFALEREFVFRQAYSHPVPYLDLDRSWAQYLTGRSQKLRKNLKAARRKLEALGTVELHDYRTPTEIETGLAIVLDLHTRSWKLKDKVEHSKSDSYQQFFRSWLLHMAFRGQARILALKCGDRPVAATIALMDGDTYYSAQIVHDREFNACSPGTLLESCELESLMQEQRYRRYDFLGSFLNNKMRWTDTATPTTHAFVMQKRFRNFILDGYYFLLKPYVRPWVIRQIRKVRAAVGGSRP